MTFAVGMVVLIPKLEMVCRGPALSGRLFHCTGAVMAKVRLPITFLG